MLEGRQLEPKFSAELPIQAVEDFFCPRTATMAITEILRHHAIRTYVRQEGVGRALRSTGSSKPPPPLQDQIVLSSTARNHQRVRQVAAQVVASRYPDLSPQEQWSRAAALEQEALLRYGGQLGGDPLSEDLLAAWLHSLHAK
jgi:hypothetical protein